MACRNTESMSNADEEWLKQINSGLCLCRTFSNIEGPPFLKYLFLKEHRGSNTIWNFPKRIKNNSKFGHGKVPNESLDQELHFKYVFGVGSGENLGKHLWNLRTSELRLECSCSYKNECKVNITCQEQKEKPDLCSWNVSKYLKQRLRH